MQEVYFRTKVSTTNKDEPSVVELRTTHNLHTIQNDRIKFIDPNTLGEVSNPFNPNINRHDATVMPKEVSDFLINQTNLVNAKHNIALRQDISTSRAVLLPTYHQNGQMYEPVFVGVSGSPYYNKDGIIVGVQSGAFVDFMGKNKQNRAAGRILNQLKDTCNKNALFEERNKKVCKLITQDIDLSKQQLAFMAIPFFEK